MVSAFASTTVLSFSRIQKLKQYLTSVQELDSLVTRKCRKKEKDVVKAVKKIRGLSHSFGQVVTGAKLVRVTFLPLSKHLSVLRKGTLTSRACREEILFQMKQ